MTCEHCYLCWRSSELFTSLRLLLIAIKTTFTAHKTKKKKKKKKKDAYVLFVFIVFSASNKYTSKDRGQFYFVYKTKLGPVKIPQLALFLLQMLFECNIVCLFFLFVCLFFLLLFFKIPSRMCWIERGIQSVGTRFSPDTFWLRTTRKKRRILTFSVVWQLRWVIIL